MAKNGSDCRADCQSKHRINPEDEEEEDRQRGKTALPCCKWDENLLSKDLDLAIIIPISIIDYILIIHMALLLHRS